MEDGSNQSQPTLPGAVRFKHRRRWPFRLAITLLAAGIIVYVIRPQPPFERYVTPPMDGRGTRIELLIPRGWRAGSSRIASTGEQRWTVIEIESPESLQWMPFWLRRVLRVDRGFRGRVKIRWLAITGIDFSHTESIQFPLSGGNMLFASVNGFSAGKGVWMVGYMCYDEPAPGTYYKTILGSVIVK